MDTGGLHILFSNHKCHVGHFFNRASLCSAVSGLACPAAKTPIVPKDCQPMMLQEHSFILLLCIIELCVLRSHVFSNIQEKVDPYGKTAL